MTRWYCTLGVLVSIIIVIVIITIIIANIIFMFQVAVEDDFTGNSSTTVSTAHQQQTPISSNFEMNPQQSSASYGHGPGPGFYGQPGPHFPGAGPGGGGVSHHPTSLALWPRNRILLHHHASLAMSATSTPARAKYRAPSRPLLGG